MSSDDIQTACRLGNLQVLEDLIKSNPCCINQLDSKLGWAPLYRASILGNLCVAQVLLRFGASPNVQNRLGETALHQAAEKNSTDLAKLLLHYKSDLNIQKNDGETPLHLACQYGHFEMTKLLLDSGADPNLPDKVHGSTPLHYACQKNHYRIVEVLLQSSADVDTLDKNQALACDLCTDPLIAELLRSSPKRDRDQTQILKHCETMHINKSSTYEEEVLCKDSVYEPESEKALPSVRISRSVQSFSFGDSCESALYPWLARNNLEGTYEALVANGFDDLDLLVEALHSKPPLTVELLKNIGVGQVGERLRLMSKLEEEIAPARPLDDKKNREASFMWCNMTAETCGLVNFPTLKNWLHGLSLGFLQKNFEKAGLGDFEQVIGLMNSGYPITDKILEEEVGVKKLGHRHRILSKLNLESKNLGSGKERRVRIERDGQLVACEMCVVI